MVIGIVGKSGAGKSDAGRFFERHGFFHIDGDEIAREIVEPGEPALTELAAAFGMGIIRQNGELDRGMLAALAFSDPKKLETLNMITHKYILARFDQLIAQGRKSVVIDAAALIESGYTKKCNTVLFIRCPRDIMLHRVMERDKLTAADAARRIDAQREDSFYVRAATYIIDNDGSKGSFEKKLEEVLKTLMAGENEGHQ